MMEFIKSLDIFWRSFDPEFYMFCFFKETDNKMPFDWVLNLGCFGIRKWRDSESKKFYSGTLNN